MSMAPTLREYLDHSGTPYELLQHPYTADSLHTAEAAHIPGAQLAKSVVLEDEHGYLLAVLPASHHVELGVLHGRLNRMLGLATERELGVLFPDCEEGAIPPLGRAYGMETVVDDSLAWQPDIYFEAGDHTGLVHMSGEAFQDLLDDTEQLSLGRHL